MIWVKKKVDVQLRTIKRNRLRVKNISKSQRFVQNTAVGSHCNHRQVQITKNLLYITMSIGSHTCKYSFLMSSIVLEASTSLLRIQSRRIPYMHWTLNKWTWCWIEGFLICRGSGWSTSVSISFVLFNRIVRTVPSGNPSNGIILFGLRIELVWSIHS